MLGPAPADLFKIIGLGVIVLFKASMIYFFVAFSKCATGGKNRNICIANAGRAMGVASFC
jgi:hypothetical protein